MLLRFGEPRRPIGPSAGRPQIAEVHMGRQLNRSCRLLLFVASAVLIPSVAIAQSAQPDRTPTGSSAIVKQADQLYDTRDYGAALALYRKAADGGDPHALMRVGFCYDQGNGVKQDDAEAARWYRKAIDAGDLEAMAFLGGLYLAGAGVPRDVGQGLTWIRKSADAGSAVGMNRLGQMYQSGEGVQKNPTEAIRLYQKAAELGEVWAMTNLGDIYLGKSGIPKNLSEASRWFRKAAELGNINSMIGLGECYEIGDQAFPKNIPEALSWYRKAADQGNENARLILMRFSWHNFDLNGDWEGYGLPGLVQVIRIVQTGSTIRAIRLRDDHSATGLPFLRGSYDASKQKDKVEIPQFGLFGALAGLAETQPAFNVASNWTATTLTIQDPDHIQIENTPPFQRTTMPNPKDVPCTPENPLHVRPLWAYIRGKQSLEAADYQVASCWFQMGVTAGDPRAGSALGDMSRKGLGTDKDPMLALAWYQSAAKGGDPQGAMRIVDMFDKGEAPPNAANAASSAFWRTKAQEMKAAQDKLIAQQLKEKAKWEAYKQMIGAVVVIGGQLLVNDVGADPACDVRARDRSGSPISNTTDPGRQREKDRLAAAGDLYCGPPAPLWPSVLPK
jgi:TPR repeat protein